MNRTLHRLIIVAAIMITSLGVTASPAQAGGKSGWGWSKPINKRLGAFYTSNRNSNLGSSKHIRRGEAVSEGVAFRDGDFAG